MKCKKGTRRAHLSSVGPSLIIKTVKEEDSFVRFAGYHEFPWQWKKRLGEFRTDALFRDDHFGTSSYNLPYSMDKKRRWVVPEILDDEIERVQDPDRSLRVSTSIHSFSTSTILQYGWGHADAIELLPTAEYHDVLRDGRVKHRVKHRSAQLSTLERDVQKKRGAENEGLSNLAYDKDLYFQKAHVRYNIAKMVHDKRPVHVYNHPKFKYDINAPKFDRGNERRTLLEQELALGRDEAEDDIESDADDDYDVAAPSEKSLLIDCIVHKSSLKRKRTCSAAKTRFVDEASRVKIVFPEREQTEEDDHFELIQHPELRLLANEHLPVKEVGGCCSICEEPFSDRASPFSLDCCHFFCSECWVRHTQGCLETGFDTVACMDPQCDEVLTMKSASVLLSPDSLAYYRSTTQESRIRNGKARRCTQCQWIVDYSGNTTDLCSCGAILCGGCSFLYHGQLPCDKAAQYNEYLKSHGLTSVAPSSNLVTELVRCPACSTPLQRSMGCDNMVCVCGALFCFKCGKEKDGNHRVAECMQKEMENAVLVDVFASVTMSGFLKKSLAEAVRRRAELAMKKREIREELRILHVSKARMYMRRIEAVFLLIEFSILRNSNPRAVRDIERALYGFLNRASGSGVNVRKKLMKRADEMFSDCIRFAQIEMFAQAE